MTLLITANKKRICNVAFISVINKVVTSKGIISIVVMSARDNQIEFSIFPIIVVRQT
jgi:hypothetical protein